MSTPTPTPQEALANAIARCREYGGTGLDEWIPRVVEAARTAERATLFPLVGAETVHEHETGCPGIDAWDVPGACSCSYPEVTRCRNCGARLKRGTPDWRPAP